MTNIDLDYINVFMKNFIRHLTIITISFMGSYQHLHAIEDVNNITYESLSKSGFTDHVRAFRKLFEIEPINSFLEFGLGAGSKFFLENCKHVTSIELLVDSCKSNVVPWYNTSLELFKNYPNWKPSLHHFSNEVNYANDFAIRGFDPEPHTDYYLKEINEFLDGLFNIKHFDLVFVDPGMHVRGDIVNCLFGRVDIIAAHDTNYNGASYGWYKIKSPESYEKIIFSYGSGITFWVVKERRDLIEKLKTAASSDF